MRNSLGIAGILVVLGAAVAQAQTSPSDISRCQRLAAYFDRYSQRGEGSLTAGKIERQIGMQECVKGNVAQGEKMLEDAIRAIGFTPPK